MFIILIGPPPPPFMFWISPLEEKQLSRAMFNPLPAGQDYCRF